MPYKDTEKGKEYRKRYYRKNKEEIRRKAEIFRKNNLEKINERARKYHQREYVKEQRKKYAEEHKEEKSQYQKEYRKNNKEKLGENHKEYYRKNREIFLKNSRKRNMDPEVIKRNRELKLIKSFGINSNKYEELLLKQKGVCAICSKPELSKHQSGTLRKLAVDHDHKTGEIRGLLCSRCNNGIGLLGDNREMLEKAVKYLK